MNKLQTSKSVIRTISITIGIGMILLYLTINIMNICCFNADECMLILRTKDVLDDNVLLKD